MMKTITNKDWNFGLQEEPEIDFGVNITWDILRGMEAQAKTFLDSGRQPTKQERRLAKNLLLAVKWIKREIYMNIRKDAEKDFQKHIDKTK